MAKQNNNQDVEFIRALATLLNENDLTELEVKREYGEADRLNVRVSRAKQIIQAAAVQAPIAAPAVAQVALPAANTAPRTASTTTICTWRKSVARRLSPSVKWIG